MANPLDIATKPLSLAFGAVRGATQIVQGLTGIGQSGESPPQEQEPDRQKEQQSRQRKQPQRRSSRQPKALDDVSITRKVETIIFRDSDVPKGDIDVNTADGVVWLRGEAKTPEMIKKLEAQAREVPEVKQVENLLHLPHTPSPTRTDTPPSQRKTRSSRQAPAKRKVTTGRTTSEHHTTSGEAAPEDLARAHEGRQAAPLGSSEGTNGSGGEQ